MDTSEILSNAKRSGNEIEYLRYHLHKESGSGKRDIRNALIKKIKSKAQVKLKSKEKAEYLLVYDTFAHGLEPVYFWVLDFMRDDIPSGLKLEVNKVEEEFHASVGGGYFGEMGARTTIMQDRALKLMELVNTVIRSIINLIYDLREFEIRLESYDDLKKGSSDKKHAAQLALKALWMDQVDIKRGRGSINLLTQDLQFVTLRDAFMEAKNEKDTNKMDLNKRVKGILKRKIHEYSKWRDFSEKELRKRFEIERSYLKVQVDSLRLYTKWARPYFRAAQKLGMNEAAFRTSAGLPSPDVVAAFNNMQMQLTLFGKKEVKPGTVFKSYKASKFARKYYACVEVEFGFRTVPQSYRTQTGSHYVHAGTISMTMRPYVFSDADLKDLEMHELYQDMEVVEHLTEVSLKELQEDIDHFLNPPQEKKKKPMFEMPFGSVFRGFKEMIGPIGTGAKGFVPKSEKGYKVNKIRAAAGEAALTSCLVLYDVFKKAHKMVTW